MKNAGNMAGQYRYRGQQGMNQPYGQDKEPKPYGPGNGYSTNYRYRPFGHYRSPASSERVKEAREEFALFVNTGSAKAMGILLTTLGIALTIMFGATCSGIYHCISVCAYSCGKTGDYPGCFWDSYCTESDYGGLR